METGIRRRESSKKDIDMEIGDMERNEERLHSLE
jgi:hypothetical protein